jgi:hypothetical protein
MFLVLLASLSLVSCATSTGGATTNNYNGGGGNGGGNGGVTTTSTKQQAINYINSNGSSVNGNMTVSTLTRGTSNGYNYTYISMIYYDTATDKFNIVDSQAQTDSSGSKCFTDIGGVAFSWGAYKSGTFMTNVNFADTYDYTCRLTGITFGTNGVISNCTFTPTKNNYPSTVDISDLRNLSNSELGNLNTTINWVASLGMPSIV